MCRGVCDSTDHVECGWCSSCHEHATSHYTCALCGDAADESGCTGPGYKHVPDETSEPTTICCGARIMGYDSEPPAWMEDQ